MKKLILTLVLTLTMIPMFGQNDTYYIVFTALQTPGYIEDTGIGHVVREMSNYPEDSHLYNLCNANFENYQQSVYYYSFSNYRLEGDPFQPQRVALSFLETVDYIDWDAVIPTMSEAEAKALYERIIRADHIYFLDRESIQNDTIEMVEAIHVYSEPGYIGL